MTEQEFIDKLLDEVGTGCWPYLIGEKTMEDFREELKKELDDEV